jgi:hypothetical protein
MKSYDVVGYVFNDDTYHAECITLTDEEEKQAMPMFAGQGEYDCYPTCNECKQKITDVQLTDEGRVYEEYQENQWIEDGQFRRMKIGSSEACMSMRVAGKIMIVQLLLTEYSACVQLYDNGTGEKFSFPILASEAGILRGQKDGEEKYYIQRSYYVDAEDIDITDYSNDDIEFFGTELPGEEGRISQAERF